MEYVETGLEIAVIGMAGRFPGAKNIEAFWDNLENGIESISFLGDDELEEISPGLRNNPNFVKTKGGVLEDKEYFDASFFHYTSIEAEYTAPQDRIFHECAWTALEDAGYDPESYNRLIGLYIGISSTAGWETLAGFSSTRDGSEPDSFTSYFLTDRDFLSTLIAYKLNLKGPAFSMNTTCSTSLVAIHLACQGLLSGDCDMALAGGTAVSFEDNKGYIYKEGMIMSPDGHCRAFDANAGGTIGGNGTGVVVLKRLEDAIKDRDNIYAVIKGSAVNNDGNRKVGYTAPSIEGQADVICKAHKMAEVNPGDIGYVETHGTATPLGDVTEVEALKLAFNTNKKHFCGLGSVKTNIGHLDVAAGVAGFIKTVLALKHKLIPPSLHFKTPNPQIDFENSPFYVNARLSKWKNEDNDRPLRAGVSSFGIGGTNAHVVLEEWGGNRENHDDHEEHEGRPFKLLLLSAKTPSALDTMTENLANYLKNNPGIILADTAYTLQVGRRRFPFRRKLTCADVSEAIARLTTPGSRMVQTYRAASEEESKPVVFMFPGLGPQYVNMGLGLYRAEPLFREEMDRCFEILKPLMGCNLKEILYPPVISNRSNRSYMSNINGTEIAQLVIFIFEYSLAKLIMNWGIKPHAMIGYSFGEYVSACLSGVFSLEDILRLLVARGKLLGRLPPGMMLSVPLPVKDVEPLLNNQLSIGIDNGSSCVVSGPEGAVRAFEKEMKGKKLLCTPLESTHGIHSQMMDPILKSFEKEMCKIALKPPQIPYISTVTGHWIRIEDAQSPAYWAKQLRAAVRFAEGMQTLLKDVNTIFLEVGPGRDISALVNREIDDRSLHHVVSLVRHPKKEIPDEFYLPDKIGLLWLYGVDIDWEAYYSGEKRNRISLPTYPFERQRFWKLVEGQKQKAAGPGEQKRELSDCFYVLSWKQTLSPLSLHSPGITNKNRSWLIFLDDDEYGLGKRLVNKLNQEQEGGKIVTVSRGGQFSEVRKDHYIIDPANKGDYDSLVKNLLTKGKFPGLLVHLWTLGGEDMDVFSYDIDYYKKCQDSGYYSLLFLVQSLVDHRIAKNLADMEDGTDSLQIGIVSNHLYAVTGEERLAAEKAPILGLCKTIPQEYPNILCRSIDVSIPSSPPANVPGLLDQLTAEFTAPCKDLTVAYRGNFRWVPQFEPLKLEAADDRPVRLREKGVYLITGGLGNDSFIRSKFLAETLGARLVLTGRTQLPAREYWQQYRLIHDDDDEISIKIGRILELERLGAAVLPISADAADEFDMKRVMQRIDSEFGELNGVIHAAGETGIESARLLAELGPGESEWHFKPKVYGLYVLEKVLNGRSPDFCLLTSSIASFTGGIGLSAYTAASIFMDTFARRHNQMSPVPWISLNWEGTSPGETAAAFTRVLSLEAVDQVLFSKTDLDRLVRERTGFKFITGNKQNGEPPDQEAAFLYSRPDLSTPYAAPGNQVEKKLADIWQRFLGMEKIGVTDDLFDLGGDSLKAANILSIIHKELNVNIPIQEFFDNPTIEGVARYLTDREGVEGAEEKKYVSIEPAEKKEYYVISSAQKRMYIFQQMNSDSTAYNSPMLKMIEGEIDTGRLEDIFRRLTRRHESLRTSIVLMGDDPVQKIESDVAFKIDYFESTRTQDEVEGGIPHSPDHFIKNFVRPFDLSKAPLMRVGLVEGNEMEYLLMMDMPHIISDGISMGVLISEFIELYEGKELPELKVQYKDYAEWQTREIGGAAIRQQEAFWLKEFEGEIPALDLPTDYMRPRTRDFEGNILRFDINSSETRDLKAFALEEGATLFMVLLSIYNIFLSKINNQDVIVVGTPTAGRFHADLEQVFGMFVNTLALKNVPAGEKTIREFLRKVKEKTLAAFANQDYQYEELVEKVMGKRDTSRSPLFDAMFLLLNMDIPVMELPGLKLKSCEYKQNTSKFDLTLICFESEKNLACTFEYSTKLFKQETIERFIGYLKKILSTVVESPDKKISEIDMVPEEEKRKLVMDFNDTAVEYPGDKTIYRLFEDQVDRIPNHVALVFKDAAVTFRHFDERANQLANYLRQKKGVRPGDRVAVLMGRSIELIVSLIAVMKSGAAYVPLDPTLPKERLRVVFNDASIGVAISQEEYRPKLTSLRDVVVLDDGGEIEKYPAGRPEEIAGVDSPAYVMYTSGSSGTPKGVLVEHRTIVNTLWWRKDFYDYNPDSVSLQNPPYFFDSSVTDIFTPLLGGARLVLIEENERVDLETLRKVIKTNKVSHFIAVPAFYNILVDEIADDLRNVKMICAAGEHFPDELVRKHFEKLPRVRIVNEYGPTENSVNTTVYELEPGSQKALIGKPIWNVGIYILDRHLCLCPIGVTGEMCLAGSSLARGYLNNPELTNEKFFGGSRGAIFQKSPPGRRRHYRTGDLGRWLPDGNIEFIGRLDTQLKIRGMRVEIGEVENHLMKHKEIKEAVVAACENRGGEKYLCAYIVPHSPQSSHSTKFKEYLSHTLPEYMIPSYFMVIDSIPFMPSGKIDRDALPSPGVPTEGRAVPLPPRNRLEMNLVEIWSEVLGIEKEEIGIDCDFFQLGGHSLKATLLAAKIHKALDVKVPLAEVFTLPTIRELSGYIEDSNLIKYAQIEPMEKREYYALSSAQKRLYIYQQLEPTGTAYNIPAVYQLKGTLDKEKFQGIFNTIIERYEVFRTAFFSVKGEVVQKIPGKVDFNVVYCESSEAEAVERLKDRVRPFDLSQAPLLRIEIYFTREGHYFIFLDMHHIISDGSSMEILIGNFVRLYEGREVVPLPVQYKDYALWQNNRLNEDKFKVQERYWLKELDGFVFTQLPIDHFDAYNRVEGKAEYLEIETSLYDKIEGFCYRHNVTKFIFMITVFQMVLAGEIEQTDITIGIPASIREHSDLKHLIGIFLNVLLIRTIIDDEDTFSNHLAKSKQTVIEALNNQEYPYEMLNDRIRENHHLKRNELFSILFNFFPVEINKEVSTDDFEVRSLEVEGIFPKYDMTLYVQDVHEYMALNVVYKANIYDAYSIKSVLDDFLDMIRLVLEQEDRTISQLTSRARDDHDDLDTEFEKYYE
jgi:amino acid adenylation domain-containing protein